MLTRPKFDRIWLRNETLRTLLVVTRRDSWMISPSSEPEFLDVLHPPAPSKETARICRSVTSGAR